MKRYLAGLIAALVIAGFYMAVGPDSIADAQGGCATQGAVPSGATGLAADCEILLDLRDTLAGTATLNWSADTPISEWEGIGVGTGTPARVVTLGLSNKSLTGTIPPQLAQLTALSALDLSTHGSVCDNDGCRPVEARLWNRLTGPIPPELGDLSNLTVLDLSGNRLSGEIPSELGRLSRLSRMSLDHNQLTGTIPPELGNLSNLTELWVSQNRLTGPIPHNFANLTALTKLFFQNNPGLCAPTDSAFQTWFRSIEEVAGYPCGWWVSEGVAAHGANLWQAAGFTGKGVKIGIIDAGYDSYHSLAGSELPLNVEVLCFTARSGRSSSDIEDCSYPGNPEWVNNHGAGSMEVLFDFAPDAEYYVTNFHHGADNLRVAVDWMIANGVDVINASQGFNWSGPGDGTSPDVNSIFSIVDAAVSEGAVWVNAADNKRFSTWLGPFNDPDGNGYHNWLGDDECNDIDVQIRDFRFSSWLRWEDDWPGAGTDLDLYVRDASGNVVLHSAGSQRGGAGDRPLELIDFDAGLEGTYCLAVRHLSGPEPGWIEFMVSQDEGLEHFTDGGGLNTAAESRNPGLLAVGAADWRDTHTIMPWSSRGPTTDGRIKPDITGATNGWSTAFGGEYGGTSGASPHVAGLAALVKSRFPDYSPVEIANYLKNNAEPRGEVPNNAWGYGFARLPTGDGMEIPPSPDREALVALYHATGGQRTLTLTPGPASPESLPNYLDWHIGDEVAPVYVNDIASSIQRVLDFGAHLGLPEPNKKIEIYIHSDLEKMSEVYADLTDNSLNQAREYWERVSLQRFHGLAGNGWVMYRPPPSEYAYASGDYVAIHEFVHVAYQHSLKSLPPRSPEAHTPRWLIEGMAEIYTAMIISNPPGSQYQEYRARSLAFAQNTDVDLSEVEQWPDWSERELISCIYRCGFMAAELLASRVGLETLAQFYEERIPGSTWQGAFETAFGMTVKEFYELYEEHRAAGFPKPNADWIPEDRRDEEAWRDQEHWLSAKHIGEWSGVEIDRHNRVVRLNLLGNRLRGEIPIQWSALSNLRDLDLGANRLSGEIPPELGDLPNLTRLNLGSNQLTGEVPAELGNLAYLQQLYLDNNQLSGKIPQQLGNLSGLMTLALQDNDLSGQVPPEMGNLSNLAYLNLGRNQLTGKIPPELGRLSNLTFLSLQENELEGQIPPELARLANLTLLHLWGNALTGSVPTQLGDLTNLERLALGRNQLSGPIPSRLGNLTNLKTLYLDNNYLTGEIPSELARLPRLEVLRLDRNQLRGAIPPQLGDLSNLEVLNLGGNGLTGEIPLQLARLSNLTHLYLWGNRLTGPVPTWLGNLPNLIDLYLLDNRLTGEIPAELGNLRNLERLSLRHNLLTGTIPSELSNLSNLALVELRGNLLTGCVPQGLHDVETNDFDTLGLPFCRNSLAGGNVLPPILEPA